MRAAKLLFVAALTFIVSLAQPAAVSAQPVPGPCQDGVLPSGALSRICIPQSGWNGDLVVFAHGYIEASQPIAFYDLTLPDGTSIPNLVQGLGFAFATTSYRQNGLTIVEGVDDIRQLVAAFPAVAGRAPIKTLMSGGSEGGIVAALAAERFPSTFAGSLSTCGPIGTFRGQVDYDGDFRVLFDIYYPGLLPGTAIAIPPVLMQHWNDVFVPIISSVVAADPARAIELLRVAKAPWDPADPSTIVKTVISVLWYNVFATNDASAKLGGNPFDNHARWYTGSGNDVLLNAIVARYVADPTALTAMLPYETSGILKIPMVTLHTTGDPIIPFGHEIIYQAKRNSQPASTGPLVQIPVVRYGHCQFQSSEVLTAFALLAALALP